MLNEIKRVLDTFDVGPVYYGGVPSKIPQSSYNYMVYNRAGSVLSNHNNSISDRYNIAIVAENFVPEGEIDQLMAALEALPGVTVDSGGVTYDYILKPNTSTVVELARFTIIRARKRGR